MVGVRMLAPVCAFAGLPIRGAHAQDVAPGPAGLPGGGAATTCTPAFDTLRDTMFVALTPVRLRDAIASAALIPALRVIVARMRPQGLAFIMLAPLPAGTVLDTRTAGSASKLPTVLATMAGEYAFVLHRDGTLSQGHVVTPTRVHGLDDAFTRALVPLTIPIPGPRSDSGPIYPGNLADDSIALRMHFSVGHDSTDAVVPFSVRFIPVTHVDRQARLAADNPKPEYPHVRSRMTDTVLVQFAIEQSGRIDMTTVRPIRAYAQLLLDSVLAVLPKLRFEPALAGGCPTRTVIVQPFVIQPPSA